MIIYYIATKHLNNIAIGVGLAFFISVLLFSKISANFFNDCSLNIKITGITGTNGKTTTTL